MKKLLILAFVLPFALWSCGGDEAKSNEGAADDGAIEINTTAQKGMKFTLKMERDENISGVDPMTKKQDTQNNKMKMEIANEVTDVDAEGNYTVTGHYTKFWMSFKMGGKQVEFESSSEIPKGADEMTKQMLQGMKDMVGKETVIVFDKKGHVKSITAEPTFFDMMYPDSTYSHADNLREMIELDAINPAGKVKVGDSWTFNAAMTNNYAMATENKVTLAERKDGKLTLAVDGKVTPNANQLACPDMSGGWVKMNLNGTRKGTYWMNEADGWVTKSENTYDLTGESIMIDGKTKKEVSNPVTLKVTDRFEYVKN